MITDLLSAMTQPLDNTIVYTGLDELPRGQLQLIAGYDNVMEASLIHCITFIPLRNWLDLHVTSISINKKWWPAGI